MQRALSFGDGFLCFLFLFCFPLLLSVVLPFVSHGCSRGCGAEAPVVAPSFDAPAPTGQPQREVPSVLQRRTLVGTGRGRGAGPPPSASAARNSLAVCSVS